MSHRYPPLPSPNARDSEDRIGRLLDMVSEIHGATVKPSERRGAIFQAVIAERQRQDLKFPGQVLPLVEPDDEKGRIDLPRRVRALANDERICREIYEERAAQGIETWHDVAREEFAEAMHALGRLQAGHGSRAEAEAECIQVIAVFVRLLESSHFDDEGATNISDDDSRSVLPATSFEACMACRIGFLVAPGDDPPKCYQCGEEVTRTTAADACRVWDNQDKNG